jgi:hypothetical protein
LGRDDLAERLGIVAFVGKHMAGGKPGDQGFGLADVAGLPRRQEEAQRIAEGIDDGMDLGGQSATRAADRTSFRPPFLPAAC